MSPRFILSILRKIAKVLFWLFLIYGLLHICIALYNIIENKNPADGSLRGIGIAYRVEGLAINRDRNHHQSFFYSKDQLVYAEENYDYDIQVKARSLFNYVSLFMKLISMGIGLGILWNFIQIFKQANLQNPFSRTLVKRFKAIAILFISLDLLKIIQYVVYNHFLSKSFPYVTVQDALFSIGGKIITGLIIWMIAIIFQRGIELQEENALTI